MTQVEFAKLIGVNQADISRWERGTRIPSPQHLGEFVGILRHVEPGSNIAYIQASPTIKYVCQFNDFTDPVAVSAGLLRFTGVQTCQELTQQRTNNWISRDVRRINRTVQADPRWAAWGIAQFETIHRDGRGRWLRTIATPISLTKTVLWEAMPFRARRPEFWVKLTALGA